LGDGIAGGLLRDGHRPWLEGQLGDMLTTYILASPHAPQLAHQLGFGLGLTAAAA